MKKISHKVFIFIPLILNLHTQKHMISRKTTFTTKEYMKSTRMKFMTEHEKHG